MIVGMTSYTAYSFFTLGEAGETLFANYGASIGRDYLAGTGTVNGVSVVNSAGGTWNLINVCLGMLFYGFTWW